MTNAPPQPELPRLSLETMADGAVAELFQAELDRVLENVLDPNAHPTKARSIVLTVTISPSEQSRTEGRVDVTAKSKLAPSIGAGGAIFIGRLRGKVVATTYNPRQMQFEFDRESALRRVGADDAPADGKAAAAGE